MATWTNNNATYYINPAYLTFVENSGYGANLIQVSASSSCYISVYIAGVVDYSDADKNYRRWKITAYNNKFPDNDKFYIYVRLEKESPSALVIYDKVLRGVHGGEIVEKTNETGDVVREEGEYDPEHPYLYIHIGEVGETDGTSIRPVSYDTGYLTSNKSNDDKSGVNDMWDLDKYSTPWLIRAKHWLSSFTVKGFISLLGGLIFKGGDGTEKPVVDIKRSTDNDEDLPVSDDNLATSKYVEEKIEGMDAKYLRKDKDDRSVGKISSDKGFEAGNYVKGFLGGSGSWIGADGYGEMSGLTLREFLEAPELRFNRVDVVSGELWNSVAFGLIEEVEETSENKGIIKIKLEENERCGLHVGDYCRGIFADFGNGSNWEGEDECGFLHLYGFWTSYFTPTQIIENEAGLFVCEYELKPETKQHPTKTMKFAVYGNPSDKSRQASAYATRTYKRYLNNVDTWVIDPDRHIYAQYGDLSGLKINGVEMKGYGSFQSNAYFSGVQIQLPPEQLESLKGDSAYSAHLTNNVGTVSLDKDGNIKDGLYEESVVTASDNGVQSEVTAKDGNGNESTVTVINHKLTTAVQAYKGSTPLYYSSTATSGSFTLSLTCVGCTAFVVNGAVIVSSITDTKNCLVNISVNCEGMAVYNLVYSIVFVQDGKDGDKGESVSMFEITPGNIILNNTSSGLQPSSVKFTLWKREGNSKHEYASHWFLLGKKASETNFTYLEYANKSFQSSYSFDFFNYVSSGYRYFQVEADDSQQTLATTEISVVKDGESYDIIPNLSVIGKTMTGSIDPESVTFKLVMNGGTDGIEADWCVYYGNVESELNNRTDTTKTSEFTFTFDSRYKYYRVDAKRGNDSLYSRYITVVSDGKDGSVGAMARYRGEFIYNNPDPYVYNSEYRDIVIHDGDVYQVYSLGTSITSAPTVPSDSDNDGKWQRASKFRFVAMDTALVDNANIAGFIFTREGYDGNGAPIGSIRSQAVNSTVSYSHSASWTDDGVYRKSPDIGDSGFTIETVTFSANEHCTVMVEMVASSENNFDKGYVGVLNRNYIDSSGGLSADIKSDNLLSVSGKESKVVQIEVDKGTYTLQMVYSKDSSKSENEDCVRYRFIGSPKLYLSSYTGTLICSDVNLTGVINANGGTFKNVNIESANITGSISVERDKYKMFISPSEAEGNPGLSWSYDKTAYARLGLWYYNGYVSGSLFVSNNGSLEESASILPNRIGVVGKRLTGDARYYETLLEGGEISMTGPSTTVSASLGVDGEGRFRIYSPYWPLEKAAGTNEMYVDGDGYVKVKSPSRK